MGAESTIEEVRRRRLRKLCEMVGSQAQLARLISRDRRQVSFWLLPANGPGAKNVSSRTARLIERQCGKPHGWLDGVESNAVPAAADKEKMRSAIELLAELDALKIKGSDLARNSEAITIAYNYVSGLRK